MKVRIANRARSRLQLIVHLSCLASILIAIVPLMRAEPADVQTTHGHDVPSKLVQLVHEYTHQFIDVNAATSAGYGAFLGCVTGPDHGAMGIHYVNLSLYADGEIDVARPEALIYEPSGDKRRLVGVEYLVDAQTWLANHNNTPPVLEGQVFQYVGSPNRFNLPAFFELHVWAWRDNPEGAFVDWNNRVSCEGQ